MCYCGSLGFLGWVTQLQWRGSIASRGRIIGGSERIPAMAQPQTSRSWTLLIVTCNRSDRKDIGMSMNGAHLQRVTYLLSGWPSTWLIIWRISEDSLVYTETREMIWRGTWWRVSQYVYAWKMKDWEDERGLREVKDVEGGFVWEDEGWDTDALTCSAFNLKWPKTRIFD